MSKKFAIIKGEIVDGIAISDSALDTDGVWIDITGISPSPGPQWSYKEGNFFPPPPNHPKPNLISKLGFRFRFTDAEYAGILGAAKTDIEIAAWVETFNMCAQINLDEDRTKNWIQTFINKSLLTQERGEKILNPFVRIDEI